MTRRQRIRSRFSFDGAVTLNANTVLTSTGDAGNIAFASTLSGPSYSLTLNGGGTIIAAGAVTLGAFILQGGNWSQLGSPLPSFQATDFEFQGRTFLRALGGHGSSDSPYQLADIYGVQGIGALLTQDFVLANDTDASTASGWNSGADFMPIGGGTTAFSGSFDGGGHTISGLTIDSRAANVGMFAVNSGTIANLVLSNVTIVSTGTNAAAGALAGTNNGLVNNVSATGTVSGQSGDGDDAMLGGLRINDGSAYPYLAWVGHPSTTSEIVSGVAPNDTTVDLLIDGTSFGQVTSASNGVFDFVLPNGTSGVALAYLPNGSTDAVSPITGAGATGLTLVTSDAVTLQGQGAAVQVSMLGTAEGGASASGILYRTSGNTVTLSPNVLLTVAGGNVTVDDAIVVSGTGLVSIGGAGIVLAANITSAAGFVLASPVALNNSVTLTGGTGVAAFGGTVDTGANNITIVADAVSLASNEPWSGTGTRAHALSLHPEQPDHLGAERNHHARADQSHRGRARRSRRGIAGDGDNRFRVGASERRLDHRRFHLRRPDDACRQFGRDRSADEECQRADARQFRRDHRFRGPWRRYRHADHFRRQP